MGPLDGKTALVTGAGRGIGRAVALLLAKEGARVIVCARSENELNETARLIADAGGEAETVECDMADEKAVIALFAHIQTMYGTLDILVNNAGVFSGAYVEDVSMAEYHRVMQVNAAAVFLCCREAFGLMKAKGGSIVSVSSLSGVQGAKKFPGFSVYCASKFAVIGITEALAEEGKQYGIRVNAVAPGAVDTGMLRDAFPGFDGPKLKPEQVADAILFLAGPRSSAVNGITLQLPSDLQKG
ncbi:MAG: SDR family oxidoreductase [Nitrospinae bacterium]|nr:SDR family oxidoreductase [Nitrospinota bacterium]